MSYLKRIAKYCSEQERSPYQVEQKLLQWGVSEDQIPDLLQQLFKHNFLNIERFIQSIIKKQFYNLHYGKVKISQLLEQHHVPDELIYQSLNQIPEDEYIQTLNHLAANKWKEIQNKPTPLQKLYQYLTFKGFEPELVQSVIEHYASQFSE